MPAAEDDRVYNIKYFSEWQSPVLWDVFLDFEMHIGVRCVRGRSRTYLPRPTSSQLAIPGARTSLAARSSTSTTPLTPRRARRRFRWALEVGQVLLNFRRGPVPCWSTSGSCAALKTSKTRAQRSQSLAEAPTPGKKWSKPFKPILEEDNNGYAAGTGVEPRLGQQRVISGPFHAGGDASVAQSCECTPALQVHALMGE